MAIYVSQMEVGGVFGVPQTPLALHLFLPGQFDNLYVKIRITHEFYRWGPPKPVLFTSLAGPETVELRTQFASGMWLQQAT